MTINDCPDYYRATNMAYYVLKRFSIDSLPVDLNKITCKIKNLKIKTYSWYANLTNLTIDDIIQDFDEMGCINYYHGTNLYLILYNENKSTETIRFTIAHELGHYFLKHYVHNKKNDKEANCFARNLLSPVPALDLICEETKYLDLENIFSISSSAAKVRLNMLCNDIKNISNTNYNDVINLFSKNIELSILVS